MIVICSNYCNVWHYTIFLCWAYITGKIQGKEIHIWETEIDVESYSLIAEQLFYM